MDDRNDPPPDNAVAIDPADRVVLRTGMQVISLDGETLGVVVSLTTADLTVEKGLVFPKDHVVPLSAVESADDRTIYLNVDKEDALNGRWIQGDAAPAGGRASG